MMVEDKEANWLDIILRGADGPSPPALDSERIKALAGRGLLSPLTLTAAEIQEMSAAVISHLVASKAR